MEPIKIEDIYRILEDAVSNHQDDQVRIGWSSAQIMIKSIKLALEQARAEGRAEMAKKAKERLNAIADTYSMQADTFKENYPEDFDGLYILLDKAIALREGASAIEALRGGGKEE